MKIRKMTLYAQVAENLNKKGVLPFSAREWNTPQIQAVVYGKTQSKDVMAEIKSVLTEMKAEEQFEALRQVVRKRFAETLNK